YAIEVLKLSAEDYGVPQRRKRLIIHGTKKGTIFFSEPKKITEFNQKNPLEIDFEERSRAITVREAIGDLPNLEPNMDGSSLPYKNEPDNPYSMLMRGLINPYEYLNLIKSKEYAIS